MHTLRGNLTPIEAGTALSNVAEASMSAVLASIDEDFGARGATGGLAAVVPGDVASGEAAPGLELRLALVHEGEPAAHYDALCRRIRDALHALTQDSLLFAPAARDESPVVASPLADFAAGFGSREASGKPGDLTRAKCIFTFGDAAIETRVEAARSEALAGEGSRAGATGEPEGSARDSAGKVSSPLEAERGGFSTVERVARKLRLQLAGRGEGIRALDSASAFRTAGERGLIDGDAAERLAQAATLWRNLQGIRRLIVDGVADVETAKPGVRAAIARSCGCDDFDALTTAVRETARQAATDIDGL